MTLRELLNKSCFENIWGILSSELGHAYFLNGKERAQTVFDGLLTRSGVKNRGVAKSMGFDMPQFIIILKLLRDTPPEKYEWSFSGYGVQSDTLYGYSLVPWDEWLDMQVCEKSVADFGDDHVAANILDEMIVLGCGFYEDGSASGKASAAKPQPQGLWVREDFGIPADGGEERASGAFLGEDDGWLDCDYEDALDREYMEMADRKNDEIIECYKRACKMQLEKPD